jgi:hypothetical protein
MYYASSFRPTVNKKKLEQNIANELVVFYTKFYWYGREFLDVMPRQNAKNRRVS